MYPSGDSETEIILKGVVRNLFIELVVCDVVRAPVCVSALGVLRIICTENNTDPGSVQNTCQLYESTCIFWLWAAASSL